MGIKVQRVVDQVHAVIEPGKKISIWKFHLITGHTGELLLRPTAKYMKIEITGKLPPCEICTQAKIRQVNVPKKKVRKYQADQGTGYLLILVLSNMKAEGEIDIG